MYASGFYFNFALIYGQSFPSLLTSARKINVALRCYISILIPATYLCTPRNLALEKYHSSICVKIKIKILNVLMYASGFYFDFALLYGQSFSSLMTVARKLMPFCVVIFLSLVMGTGKINVVIFFT